MDNQIVLHRTTQFKNYDSDLSQLKVYIGDNKSCFVILKNDDEETLVFFDNILKGQNLYLNSGAKLFNSKKIKKIACTMNICHFISNDGQLYSWGEDFNQEGLLGINENYSLLTPTLNTNFINIRIVDIAMSPTHCCCIDTYREVYLWGSGHINQNLPIKINLKMKNNTIISKIFCGEFFTGEVFYIGKLDTKIYEVSPEPLEPKYLPKRGIRDLYVGRNVLYFKDNKNLFYYYNEKDKIQKLDLKVHISDVKVIGNNAYVYNCESNYIYEVIYSKFGIVSKKIHVLSELVKNKILVHETPYFYDTLIFMQKEHAKLNFNKINLITKSVEVSNSENSKELLVSKESLMDSRKNNFDQHIRKSVMLQSNPEIYNEYDVDMYPVNKHTEQYKKGTAISPSHYKIQSIYSVIHNMNKSVERRKSHSPMSYFKKLSESISSDIYSVLGIENKYSNVSQLSPDHSKKMKKMEFTKNLKILEKENSALPQLKLSDIIKPNSDNDSNVQVLSSLNQVGSPMYKSMNSSLTIDSNNKFSVVTKGADMSTFTPKSSVCTNRQTNFTITQSQIVKSHNYSFSINQEGSKNASMIDKKTVINPYMQPTQTSQSSEFNFSDIQIESSQPSQAPASLYFRKSIPNKPKLNISKKYSEPIKLLNKSSNDIEIPQNIKMVKEKLVEPKKMEILSIRDKPQFIIDTQIDKNFERRNTLQPIELEGTQTFQTATRRSDIEIDSTMYKGQENLNNALGVQEIINTQEAQIENSTIQKDTIENKPQTIENKANNNNNIIASFKSSNEFTKHNSPKKLGLIQKAKYFIQENNIMPIKNPNLNNSINFSDNKTIETSQKNILSSSNAFSTKSAKTNVIDLYTQKARERSVSVSSKTRTPVKSQPRKSRELNTSFSNYIKNK